MDNFSPTNFSRLIDNRTLRRNRLSDEMDPEESLNSEEEIAFEKWNPDVETVNINWKGWKRSEHPKLRRGARPIDSKDKGAVLRLSELAARCVAIHIPFEMVEKFQPPVPEELQQRITFWSFPEGDDDICLYTCLANSNDDEFLRGEILFENGNVYDVIQIGFHLNATVGLNAGEKFSVSISFDRRRITSCICTCKSVPLWCCHIVAVCLLRIYNPEKVQLRPPISESLTQLNRDQLQKFSQYLVSSLPEQYLQTAQRLLDDLSSGQPLPINTVSGAPDTTAGASVSEYAMWCLDDHQLHLNVKKQMNRFGNVPPMVFSDVNMLTNNIPAIINEYNSMLRPLKIGEPDSLWNLLSIVRDMYRKNDHNALPLLEIITEEMTNCVQIVLWWFANKSGLNGDCGYQIKYYYNGNSNSYIYQASAARLCDEIVSLWRLAALNPAITPKERVSLCWKFKDWHLKIIELIWNNWKNTPNTFDLFNFSGFKPCVEACKLTWSNFPLPGITYHRCNPSKKGNLLTYETHPFTFGIDIKNLDYIKHPTPAMQNALRYCFMHVERIRSTVAKIVSDSPVPADLPDSRTIKYLKEHFSPARDEVYHFVAHLISLVDTWVNDECDENESYSSMNSEKSATFIKSDGDDFATFGHPTNSEQKIILERKINSEMRRKLSSSSICTLDTEELDEFSSYLVSNYGLDAYEFFMGEFGADKAQSSHSSHKNSHLFYDAIGLSSNSSSLETAIFETFSDMDDIWQTLIARAEGLWAFGHLKEACFIGRKIAENIVSHPPDQKMMCCGAFVKSKRRKGQAVINPIAHRLTLMAVEKMELFRFLLNLLSSFREHYDIAFKIGLLSLELPRAPASIKPLEVKLFHLENDVADLLRKIPLTDEQYKSLRIRLEKLKAGTYKARGYKLLPNALTSYILDVTMMNTLDGKCRSVSREISESLCFEAALASLSLKPDVCEFEHSLLVEGLRRQRCDLALRMLDLYKDDPKKIFKIMDVIIDQDIDVNMKKPLHLWYYQDKPKQEERLKSLIGRHKKKRSRRKPGPPVQLPCKMFKKMTNYVVPLIMPINQNSPNVPPLRHLCNMPNPLQMPQGAPSMSPNHPYMPTNTTYMPHSHHMRPLPGGSGPPNMSVTPLPLPHQMNPSQAAAEVSLTSPSVPNQLPIPFSSLMQPSFPVVPAPALPPGIFPRGPMPTSKVSQKYGIKTAQGRTLQHPNGGKNCSRASSISSKSNKNKCGKSGCKRLVSIVYKNRSTEALAHSMTELAKSVLFRSGGHLASSFYIRDSETGSVKTPNHVLHMCALQLAMYGLGISNNASTSWESRSYSPHVAMLTSLAIDIGAPAFMFIIENWPGHLTPSEAISLADRGSRSENPIVTNLAAKLALSCLTHADKLNSHEIIQAINQCQNLGFEMQEKACCEVEVVAKSHSLQSEVLFYISKLWYNIYMKDESEDAEENENVRGVANNSKCSLNMNVSCFPINRAALALNNQSKTSTPVINDIKLLQKRTYYLLTSYRLSMMAFQNLTSETSEEKAHYRFHCLPNYTTDVNRTMQIAKLLGDKWVHHFCMVVESTLVNPFLLYEVASSAAFYFARYNPSTLHYYMRTVVDSLINKCQTMFFFYLNSKLFNMAQYEEDEYINMAQLAHKAFSVSADGPYRYQEWLQSIRSKNVAIRDLYTKITDAIEQEERMSKNTIRDTTEAVAKESMLAGNSAQASGPGSSIGGGANPGVRLIVDDEEEDEDDDDDEDEDDEEDDDEDEDEEEDEYEEEEDEDGSKSNAAAGNAAEHAAPMSRHRAGLPGDAAQPGPSGFSKCKNKDASNDGERVQRK